MLLLLRSCTYLSGPMGFIDVDTTRCNTADGMFCAAAFTELTLELARELRSGWESYLGKKNICERGKPVYRSSSGSSVQVRLLGRIWRLIVKVDEHVSCFQVREDTSLIKEYYQANCERMPHVTWCPDRSHNYRCTLRAWTMKPLSCASMTSGILIHTVTLCARAKYQRACEAAAQSERCHCDAARYTRHATRNCLTTVEGARLQAILPESHITLSVFDGQQATVNDALAAILSLINQDLHLACRWNGAAFRRGYMRRVSKYRGSWALQAAHSLAASGRPRACARGRHRPLTP